MIIFSGYNQRALVAFIRTLESNGVDYVIIASSKDDDILLTEYSDKVIFVRKEKDLVIEEVIEAVNSAKQAISQVNGKYYIAPSTEYLNRFLLKHINKLRSINVDVPLVDLNKYEVFSDKDRFVKLCKKYNICVPKECKSVETLEIPFVAKPNHYVASDGKIHSPYIVELEKEKTELLSKINSADFTFQKYVGGKSVYLLYYVDKQSRIYKLSQQNYVQQTGGKSVIAAELYDIHESNISTHFENLLIKEGFRGLIMIEIKELPNGEYRMIEANPRFWGPSQLFVDSGYNLFKLMLIDYGYLSEDIKNSKTINTKARYFWSGGFDNKTNTISNIKYHNYDFSKLKSDIAGWLKSDIYNRSDTIKVYRKEAENNGQESKKIK